MREKRKRSSQEDSETVLRETKTKPWNVQGATFARTLPSTKRIISSLCSANIPTLPSDIGQLQDLQNLYLDYSTISSLPPSIGQLQNLKILNLSYTKNLSNLPRDFGANLISLEELRSNVVSLPPSIGQLQNLKILKIAHLYLKKLPNEIGDLVNLIELDFRRSAVKTLPRSNVNLGKLRKLAFDSAFLGELPLSLKRLTNLRELDVGPFMGVGTIDTQLLDLVHCLPLLGVINEGEFMHIMSEELVYTLACNRFRSRTPFGTNESIGDTIGKLWPILLEHPTRAFQRCTDCRSGGSTIGKLDAVYKLLVDGRKSFVEVLIDRSNRSNRSSNKISGNVAKKGTKSSHSSSSSSSSDINTNAKSRIRSKNETKPLKKSKRFCLSIDQLKGPAGSADLARHAQLDASIELEWCRGTRDLPPNVLPLIHDQSLPALKRLGLRDKQL
jgi:hypothetical protein